MTSPAPVVSPTINIPIVREKKADVTDLSSRLKQTSKETQLMSQEGESGSLKNICQAMNPGLKETNIEVERVAEPKTRKSCLKTETKAKVPISIKIPIIHEPPSETFLNKGKESDTDKCRNHCKTNNNGGGLCDVPLCISLHCCGRWLAREG